jgi:hypothetical protein
MSWPKGVPLGRKVPGSGRKVGSLNKFSIGRMEAAIAAEHPEYTYLQRQKALATALTDRWEHTKRYTEAEDRAIEALSRVLDRIMPYLHHKRTAGDSPENKLHVDLDLSGLTDEEVAFGTRIAIKAGVGHTAAVDASPGMAGRAAEATGTRRAGGGKAKLRKAPTPAGKARRPPGVR